MKKFVSTVIVIVVLLVLCLSLSAYFKPARNTGSSEVFTENEINKAMDTVEKYFRKNFKDCKLTKLWYDEEITIREAEDDYTSGKTIVILSNFTVGDNGPVALNDNYTYENYMFTLVRDDSKSSWKVKDSGY